METLANYFKSGGILSPEQVSQVLEACTNAKIQSVSDLEFMVDEIPEFLTKEMGLPQITELRVLQQLGFKKLTSLTTNDVMFLLFNWGFSEKCRCAVIENYLNGEHLSIMNSVELILRNGILDSELEALRLLNKIEEVKSRRISPKLLRKIPDDNYWRDLGSLQRISKSEDGDMGKLPGFDVIPDSASDSPIIYAKKPSNSKHVAKSASNKNKTSNMKRFREGSEVYSSDEDENPIKITKLPSPRTITKQQQQASPSIAQQEPVLSRRSSNSNSSRGADKLTHTGIKAELNIHHKVTLSSHVSFLSMCLWYVVCGAVSCRDRQADERECNRHRLGNLQPQRILQP